MNWADELLVRDRQRELLAEAAQQRLVAEARRVEGGSHLRRRVRALAAQVRSAVRLRSRLA